MEENKDGQSYYSLNKYLKKTFGRKVYKIALNGGFTCPNRDGRAGCGADGIKLQLLHVLKGTDLEKDYLQGKVSVMTMGEYVSLVGECLAIIPKDMVVHRLTGDGDKKTLVAPLWSADKKRVLNAIRASLRNMDQGM